MNKNNSPEQKAQWKLWQRRHPAFSIRKPAAKGTVAFWNWNRHFRLSLLTTPFRKVKGAFGRRSEEKFSHGRGRNPSSGARVLAKLAGQWRVAN